MKSVKVFLSVLAVLATVGVVGLQSNVAALVVAKPSVSVVKKPITVALPVRGPVMPVIVNPPVSVVKKPITVALPLPPVRGPVLPPSL